MSPHSTFDPFKSLYDFWIEGIKKSVQFFTSNSALIRTIFKEMITEMTTTMTRHVHLYINKRKNKVEGNLR